MVSYRFRGQRVLAVDPHIRLIGWVCLHHGELVDWGNRTARHDQPVVRLKKSVIPFLVALLDRFEPRALLLPAAMGGQGRRSRYVVEALEAVTKEARRRDIPVFVFTNPQVKDAFRDGQGKAARNKNTVNRALVARYPQLMTWMPRMRRHAEPQPYSTPLFNAVALYGAWLDWLERNQ